MLLIGGTVTGLMALSLDSDLERDCTDGHCPSSRGSDIDRLDSLATVTNGLLAMGAIACVTGTGLWLFGAPSENPEPVPTARVGLHVGTDLMAAEVTGKF